MWVSIFSPHRSCSLVSRGGRSLDPLFFNTVVSFLISFDILEQATDPGHILRFEFKRAELELGTANYRTQVSEFPPRWVEPPFAIEVRLTALE